jgi:hypothetical protein
MSNVVQFGKKPEEPEDSNPTVWTCGSCGCQNFFLYSDGSTECSLCGSIDTNQRGGWLEQLEPDPEFDEDTQPRENVAHGTEDFARAAVVKAIDKEAVAIVVLWPTGRIKLWSVFDRSDSEERKGWLRRTLDVAASLALGERSDTNDLPDK